MSWAANDRPYRQVRHLTLLTAYFLPLMYRFSRICSVVAAQLRGHYDPTEQIPSYLSLCHLSTVNYLSPSRMFMHASRTERATGAATELPAPPPSTTTMNARG